MIALDIFAFIILLVLIVAVVAVLILLGMMPGRIARKRNHPQAEAINMCGWWGLITMGLLLPLAYIWAYTNPRYRLSGAPLEETEAASPEEGEGESS
jgi:hypothetical protein